MNARTRLVVWIVVVAGALSAPALLHIPDWGAPLALVQGGVTLAIALGLLATTPVGAIVLPAWMSVLLLPVGVYVQAVVAGGAGVGVPMSTWYAIALTFVGAWLLEFPDTVSRRAPEHAGSRLVSSWWLALVSWHPALWIGPPGAQADVRTGALGLALLAALIPARLAPRLGAIGWIASVCLLSLAV